jgi:hypothetical protein
MKTVALDTLVQVSGEELAALGQCEADRDETPCQSKRFAARLGSIL